MLLNEAEELERRAARFLGAGFPRLDRAFAGLEIPRKHRLAHLAIFAQPLDIGRRTAERPCSLLKG